MFGFFLIAILVIAMWMVINRMRLTHAATISDSKPNFSCHIEMLETRHLLSADIAGLVWHDLNNNGLKDTNESGVANVAVELFHAGSDGLVGGGDDSSLEVAVSEISGHYEFQAVPMGNHYVTVRTPVGFSIALADQGSSDVVDSDFDQTTGNSAVVAVASTLIELDAGLIGAPLEFGYAFALKDVDLTTSHDLAIDGQGHLISVGSFTRTADFDAGPGESLLQADVSRDIFIAKYTETGSLIWARAINHIIDSDEAFAVDVDQEGNIYVTGYYKDEVDFDPGPDVFTLPGFSKENVFILKLDKDGVFVWAKRLEGGGGDQRGTDITISDSGNIAVVGAFDGRIDLDPGSGEVIFESSNASGFIVQLDSTGEFTWGFALEVTNVSNAEFAQNGDLIVAGNYQDSFDIDPGMGNVVITGHGGSDFYVARYSSIGQLHWAFGIGGTDSDLVQDLVVNNTGQVYVVGAYEEVVDFDGGPGVHLVSASDTSRSDAFVSKYDMDGQFLWARSTGGFRESDSARNVAVDSNDNVFIAGSFRDIADFDPGPSEYLIESSDSTDIFFWNLDGDGNFLSAQTIGNEDSFDFTRDIILSETGQIFAVGQSYGVTDFDPGPDTFIIDVEVNSHFQLMLNPLNSIRVENWSDENGDGIRDVAEPSISGLLIEVLSVGDNGTKGGGDDVVAGQLFSDVIGAAEAFNLSGGRYYLRTTLPAGVGISPRDQGANDLLDSDFEPASGESDVFEATSGQLITGIDIGMTGFVGGSVAGQVWDDFDADGTHDQGEPGIHLVAIELVGVGADGEILGGDDRSVGTVLTDATGGFSFDGIVPGDYYLSVVPPTSFFLSPADQGNDETDSDVDPQTHLSGIVTLVDDGSVTSDVGMYRKATVASHVFFDANGDGLQSPDESGVADVLVELISAGPDGGFGGGDDSLIESATTDLNGNYSIAGLTPGDYYALFEIADDRTFTLPNAGDATLDSNVIESRSGRTNVFSLVSGQDELSIDAGVRPRFVSAGILGSLAYRYTGEGVAGLGIAENTHLAFDLDVNQTLSVVVAPSGSLKATISIFSPTNVLLGTVSAPTSGSSVVFNGAAVQSAGTYRIEVDAVDGTSGEFDIEILLNAANELEQISDHGQNNSLANAESLDSVFTDLQDLASIATVLGQFSGDSEGFESGMLDDQWSTYASTELGITFLAGSLPPLGAGNGTGDFSLFMAATDFGTFNLNEAIWTVDVSGLSDLILGFEHFEYSDVEHPFSGSFEDHANADGISISVDGTNWFPVFVPTNQSNGDWITYALDLTNAIANAGISTDSELHIKFQQYGDGSLSNHGPTDGRGWDSISLASTTLDEDWYRIHLDASEALTLAIDGVSSNQLELYDSNQQLIGRGFDTSTVTGPRIDGFIAPTTGDYFIRVTGDAGTEYSLTATKNAVFDNGTLHRPQSLDPSAVAIGYLYDGGDASTGGSVNEVEVNDDGVSGISFGDIAFAQDLSNAWTRLSEDRAAIHLTGRLDYQGDVDLYRVQVSNGDRLTVDLTGSTNQLISHAQFQLLDADGEFIDGGSAGSSEITFDDLDHEGELFIVVEAGTDTGNYALDLVIETDTPLFPTFDDYAFAADAGDEVTINTFTVAGGPGDFDNGIDPTIQLMDLHGNVLAFDDNSGLDNINATFDFTIADAGTYLIRVESVPGTQGEYGLAVSGHGGGLIGHVTSFRPIDPLGSLAFATQFEGVIAYTDETDSTDFTLAENQTISLVVTGQQGLRPSVELLDPNGQSVGADTAAVLNGTASLHTVTAVDTGVYTIRVTGDGNTLGLYGVDVWLNTALEMEMAEGSNDVTLSAESIESSFREFDGAEIGGVIGLLGGNRITTYELLRLGGDLVEFQFEGLPTPSADGSVTVTIVADLDQTDEYVILEAEGIISEVLFGDGDDEGEGPRTATINLSSTELSDLAADGVINFTVTASQGYAMTTGNVLTVEMHYSEIGAFADLYSIDLAAGESASIAFERLTGHGFDIELLDSAGDLLSRGTSASNADVVFPELTAPAQGEYFLRVTSSDGMGGRYHVVVVRNGRFDIEFSDVTQTIDLTSASQVFGYAGRASGSIFAQDFKVSSTGNTISRLDVVTGEEEAFFNISLVNFDVETLAMTPTTLILGSNRHNPIIEVDPTTGEFIREIVDLGTDLNALAYQDGQLFVSTRSGGEHFLTIDYYTGEVIDSFDIPASPQGYFDGFAATSTHIYGRRGNDIYLIDDAAQTITLHGSIEGINTPSGLGIVGNELFVIERATSDPTNSQIHVFDLATLTLQRIVDGTGNATNIGADGGSEIADEFTVFANAGDTLTVETQTPTYSSNGRTNLLNPALELFDANGNIVGLDADGSTDGINAKLTHVVQQPGRYTIRVIDEGNTEGEYILRVSGQTGDPASFAAIAISPFDNQHTKVAPTRAIIDFTQHVLPSSVAASDLTINGNASTGFEFIDADTIAFDLPVLVPDVEHVLRIDTGDVTSISGDALEVFVNRFVFDTLPPQVVATSIQSGELVDAGTLVYTIQFSEPILSDQLGVDDFELHSSDFGIQHPNSIAYDSTTFSLTLTFLNLPEADFTLTVPSGNLQVEDLAGFDLDGELLTSPLPPNVSGDGIPGGDFVLSFETDVATLPLRLEQVLPLGSWVHRATHTGRMAAAVDVDRFTIDLDAGQTVAALLTLAGGLQASLEMFSPSLQSMGVSTANGANETLLIQSLPVETSGTYTFEIVGLNGTTGTYSIEAILNAAVDVGIVGQLNHDITTAQSLANDFLSLGNSASRAGVMGSADGGGFSQSFFETGTLFNPNVLTFTFDDVPMPLDRGELTISALSDLEANHESLLIDIDGIVTETLFENGGRNDILSIGIIPLSLEQLQAITADGQIVVTVTPSVTVDSYTDEQLTVELEYLAIDSTKDLYEFELNAGDTLHLAVQKRATGPILIELLDENGNLLVSGTDQNGNLSQSISDFVSTTGGTFFAAVSGRKDTTYTLLVSRNSVFDTELNSLVASQSLSIPTAFGGLFGLNTADDYRLSVNAGDELVFQTSTPFDGPFLFQNALDPLLELFDPTGTLVAMAVDGASDGRNAVLMHTATMTGEYVVRVRPEGPLPLNGLVGEYYNIGVPLTTLPDFDALTPAFTRVDTTIDFPSTAGEFAGSGLIEHFAVRWTGGIHVNEDRIYEFLLTSDDGSRLFIDDQLVVDNDGTHGMVQESGTIMLDAGLHALRIEYFENLGGSGLVFQYDQHETRLGRHPVVLTEDLFQSTTPLPEFGSYVIHAEGHTGAPMSFQVTNVDPGDDQLLSNAVGQLLVHASHAIDPSSINIANVLINGNAATGFNIVDGNTVAFQLATPLMDGNHSVSIGAGAMQSINGQSNGAFATQFEIDSIAPAISVDNLFTSDTLPSLSGTIDDPQAQIRIRLNNQSYVATNHGNGTWTLPEGTILTPLELNWYEVIATAIDDAGNIGTDQTQRELVVAEVAVQFTTHEIDTADESNAIYNVDIRVDTANGLPLIADASFILRFSGTARRGFDYINIPNQMITFDSGTANGTIHTVAVEVLPDFNLENDETIILKLSDPSLGVVIAQEMNVITLTDDDSATVQFETSASAVDEGDTLSTIVTLQVANGGTLDVPVFADFIDGNSGTAEAGIDYADDGIDTIRFYRTNTSASIHYAIFEDSLIEQDETIELMIAGVTHPRVTVGPVGIHTATIIDNDEFNSPPELTGVPDLLMLVNGSDNSIVLADYFNDLETDFSNATFSVTSSFAGVAAAIDQATTQLTVSGDIDFVGEGDITVQVMDEGGMIAMDSIHVTVAAIEVVLPIVQEVEINNSLPQRSILQSLSFVFSEDVFASGALALMNITTGESIDPQALHFTFDGVTNTGTWTFPGLENSKLPDGNYVATLDSSQVTDASGNPLDGNNDGSTADYMVEFFSYFGDDNGDRNVDIADLFPFRSSYLTSDQESEYRWWFDFDSNGAIELLDLFRFRNQFGSRLDEPTMQAPMMAPLIALVWYTYDADVDDLDDALKEYPWAGIDELGEFQFEYPK